MRRFTVARERIEGDHVRFDRDETRHLARVLRLRPGDTVIAVDGSGRDYTVRIETLGESASGTILDVRTGVADSPLAITLFQGVPKADKMEAIVRAVTELGVARIVPVIAERTIVRLDAPRWRERARRWQRVAREAAKQCGRATIPAVDTPRPLAECLGPSALDAAAPELRLCLWEAESSPLATTLAGLGQIPAAVSVLVGPEGGLARAEVETARSAGWHVAGLGPRILRTETAGPAVVAILQSRFGDLARAAPATR